MSTRAQAGTCAPPLRIAAFASCTATVDGFDLTGPLLPREDIPMLWRRRLRGLEMTAMQCALGILQWCDQGVDLVFASRHGNLERTRQQLERIGNQDPPSPLEFALSVHNAFAGMIDLLRRERVGHTSITAGAETLSAALLESYIRRLEDARRALLLLYLEHPILPSLAKPIGAGSGGTVLALLFGGADDDAVDATMQGSPRLDCADEVAPEAADSEAQANKLVTALKTRQPATIGATTATAWQLRWAS